MGRSPQAWTEEKIEKRFADGFGQGVGAEYRPWLTVGRSTPSLGTSNRSGGRTTGRVHHLLSDIERNAFLIYDWAASVVDIREQFPLDRGETRAIAEAMGVRHPIYPKSDVPVVMTTDFLLDTAVDGRAVQAARAVKPAAERSDRRVLEKLEKLEIARRCWVRRGVDGGIVTERDLPPVLIQNLTWLAGPWARDEWKSGDADRVAALEEALSADGDVTFGEFCPAMDRRPGMVRGMTPNALIPANSDAPGRDRPTRASRRGRAVTFGLKGLNVDRALRDRTRDAVAGYHGMRCRIHVKERHWLLLLRAAHAACPGRRNTADPVSPPSLPPYGVVVMENPSTP